MPPEDLGNYNLGSYASTLGAQMGKTHLIKASCSQTLLGVF